MVADLTCVQSQNWVNDVKHTRRVSDSVGAAALTKTMSCRYHMAKKQIPSQSGHVAGIKLEQFIFDPFPLAPRWTLFEVDRAAEFAPVKNASADGVADSPATARRALMTLHRRWVEAAGGSFDGSDEEGLEVAAGVSYGGEGLQERCAGQTFRANDYIAV